MREISSTLRAAGTAWNGAPLARVTVRDRRLHWRRLDWQPARPDTPLVAQASSGAWMLRLKTDANGDLWLARIASTIFPGDAWTTWARIGAGVALPDGDCALAHWAGRWYAYYVGAGDRVHRLVSDDDGLCWSAPLLVHDASRTAFVAAAGRWLFCQEHQVHAYASDPATGALSGPYTQSAPTTNGGHGLAAVRDADDDQPDAGGAVRYRLLFTIKGSIHAVSFDPATCTYGQARRVAPGADQTPAGAADYRYPALCRVDAGQLVATWIERHDASLTGEAASWLYPVARVCLDGEGAHYGCETPLAAPGDTSARLAALFDHAEQNLYLGNDRLLLSARAYSDDPVWHMRFGPTEAIEYTLHQHPNRPSDLTLTLLDSAGQWANPGLPRLPEAPLRPLAEVTLTRGYATAAGAETVDLPPWHLVRVQRSEGRDGGRVRLYCTDALGLLGLWRAPEELAWKQRAVGWLLAELCARVGLRYRDDGQPALARTLPLFVLHAGQPALDGVLALLRLGGCVARVAPDGALWPLPWPTSGAPQMTIGALDEVRRGAYGPRALAATNVRVSSGGAYAEAEAIDDAWAMGLRLSAALHDGRIGLNVDLANAVRDRELGLAALAWRADEVVIPTRVDLELWDRVLLTCEATAYASAPDERVVTGICERRDVARGVAEMVVALGRG